jgi:RNA polymerase sigma-70 factor, ECF subfamily
MPSSPSWLEHVLSGDPDHEREVVDRYTLGLLEVARRQLPDRIRRRVDPEDIVQSVYRSFFRRLDKGEFAFEESHDVWRLLAVMTFRKSRNQVKHHRRLQRDAFRETSYRPSSDSGPTHELVDPAPDASDVAMMVEHLEQLLAGLPERHHRLVSLRLEGLSTSEIARETGVSKRTVLRVLARLQELAETIIGADE